MIDNLGPTQPLITAEFSSSIEDSPNDLDENILSLHRKKPVARLSITTPVEKAGESIKIYEGKNLVGRTEECRVRFDYSKNVSKQHACIEIIDGDHLIYDLDSLNKTKLRSKILTPQVRYELQDQVCVTFGDVSCTYIKYKKSKNHTFSSDEKPSTFSSSISSTCRSIISNLLINHVEEKDPKDKSNQDIDKTRAMVDQSLVQDTPGFLTDFAAAKTRRTFLGAVLDDSQDEYNNPIVQDTPRLFGSGAFVVPETPRLSLENFPSNFRLHLTCNDSDASISSAPKEVSFKEPLREIFGSSKRNSAEKKTPKRQSIKSIIITSSGKGKEKEYKPSSNRKRQRAENSTNQKVKPKRKAKKVTADFLSSPEIDDGESLATFVKKIPKFKVPKEKKKPKSVMPKTKTDSEDDMLLKMIQESMSENDDLPLKVFKSSSFGETKQKSTSVLDKSVNKRKICSDDISLAEILHKEKKRRSSLLTKENDVLKTSKPKEKTIHIPKKSPAKKQKNLTTPLAVSKNVKPTKKMHIALTGFDDVQTTRYTGIIAKLGGVLVESMKLCECLVAQKFKRTTKLLCAVAKGIPVVGSSWLESSADEEYFLDPMICLFQDESVFKTYKFDLKASLQTALKHPLLSPYCIFVTPSVKPDPGQMKEIIESAGGKFLPKSPTKRTCDASKTIVICCKEDLPGFKTKLENLAVPVVTSEFILTGILRQKVEIDEFRLKFD